MHQRIISVGVILLLSSQVAADENRINTARAAAQAYLRQHAKSYGIDSEKELREYSATDEPEYRLTHLKYVQVFSGLPVLYSHLFLHVKDDGGVRPQNMLKGAVHVETIVPAISALDAAQFAAKGEHVIGPYEVINSVLAILPRHSIDERPPSDRLVWQVTLHVENELEPLKSFEAVVDAADGKIWTSYSLIREFALKVNSPYLHGAYMPDSRRAPAIGVPCTTKTCAVTIKELWLRDPCWGFGHAPSNPTYLSDASGIICGTVGTGGDWFAEDGGNWVGDAANTTTTTGNLWKQDVLKSGSVIGDGIPGATHTSTMAADAYRALKVTFDNLWIQYQRKGLNGSNGPSLRVLIRSTATPNNAQWVATKNAIVVGSGDGTQYFPLNAFDVIAHEIGHALDTYGPHMISNTACAQTNKIMEGTADMLR